MGSTTPRVANPRRRVRALLLAILLIFTVFGAQLLRIQGFDASATQTLAATKRKGTEIIPAMRGRILDADGGVLAASYERRTVTADQVAVTKFDPKGTPDGVAAAAQRLAPLLKMSQKQLTKILTGTKQYVVVAKGVTPTTWRKISQLGINGIYSEPASLRSYPAGSVTGTLVGFVYPSDQRAATGIEAMADAQLAGVPGSRVFERTRYGAPIAGTERVEKLAVDGLDVRTTIDADLQYVAQSALESAARDAHATAAYVVVMEVATGRLLAVASTPTLDPAKPAATAPDRRENRAFLDVYEPGSTGKVMTMAAAINEGTITPTTPVIVPTRLHRSDVWFKDHMPHGVQQLTTTGVLAHSSNMGTILAGETISAQTMEEYYRAFGIGSSTGIGYPGEGAGYLAPAQEQSGSQRYTILFGQGYSVTAIQAASVFQTIANGGVRVQPRLIDGYVSPDGTFEAAPASSRRRVVSKATAGQVGLMLEAVTGEGGTGWRAVIPGYRVAGKTGTADRYNDTLKKYAGVTGSFIGFAPVDHPRFVVAVTYQNPTVGRFGGLIGAPVFKKVMTFALQKYGIQPTGTTKPKYAIDAPGAESDPRTLRP